MDIYHHGSKKDMDYHMDLISQGTKRNYVAGESEILSRLSCGWNYAVNWKRTERDSEERKYILVMRGVWFG